jgi:hypothetical protein
MKINQMELVKNLQENLNKVNTGDDQWEKISVNYWEKHGNSRIYINCKDPCGRDHRALNYFFTLRQRPLGVLFIKYGRAERWTKWTRGMKWMIDFQKNSKLKLERVESLSCNAYERGLVENIVEKILKELNEEDQK